MASAHLLISGKVQGVFFRHNTQKKAHSFGLKGWVRNTDDGKVEAVIQGPQKKIEELIEWARQGPRLARVKEVNVNWEESKNDFDEFQIKH